MIATLTEQLQAVGQTVRRTDGHSQLAPAATPLDAERVQAIARNSDPLDPDDARALLRVLRSSSRNRHWEDFTADEHESIMRLIAQGALTDTGATVQPSIETKEALTQGYRTTEGDFPPASRFRTLDEEEELARRLAELCTLSSDISTFISSNDG